MSSPPFDLHATIVAAWRTNNRVNISLVQDLPSTLWDTQVPDVPHRTVRMIAAHIHNCRCRWIKTLGRQHGLAAPDRVDHHRVGRRELVAALKTQREGD